MISPDHPRTLALLWLLLLPAVALSLAAVIVLVDANYSLFLRLNGIWWIGGEEVWSLFTVLGDTLTLLVILMFFVGRRPDLIWPVMVALLVVSLFVHFGKLFFDVQRPTQVVHEAYINVIGFRASNESFPSGHTAAAFALAAAFCMLRFPLWVKIAVLTLAVLAGLSRIVVGVHWPLDVLAGAAIGWLGMGISIKLASLMKWGYGNYVQCAFAVLLSLVSLYALLGFDGGYPQVRWFFIVLPLLAFYFSMSYMWRCARGKI